MRIKTQNICSSQTKSTLCNFLKNFKKLLILSKGISQAFKVYKKVGGQIPPKPGLGLKLEWKKAQKNPKKNIISETMNKITPNFNPAWAE